MNGNNVAYAISMALACLIAYWLMTGVLNKIVSPGDDLLGGMWAAVAAAFVFRDAQQASLSAGLSRLIATFISFVLCLVYLLVAKPTPIGMAVLVAVGTLILVLIKRREEIITTAITTIVVMAVSILDPSDAVKQPLLRMLDTVVGVAVGVAVRLACNAYRPRA